jgi:hypothetical protein
VHIQIQSQVLGYAPDALDAPIPSFARTVKHTIFHHKARGPLDGNTNLQPSVDPAPKSRIPDGEILGAVIKDALADGVILDAARR